MKVPDERVNRLKADIEKFGSFPQFVDALYDAYLAGEISPVEPSEEADGAVYVPAAALPQIDEQKMLDAIADAKQSILSVLAQYSSEVSSLRQAPVAAPAAPAPQAAPSNSDAFASHKDAIIKQIFATHQVELARLDDMLAEIRSISAHTASPVVEPPSLSESPTQALPKADFPSNAKTTSVLGIASFADDVAHADADSEDAAADDEEATMTREEAASFVDELIGWVSDKDVEAESDLDVLELVKAKNSMEAPVAEPAAPAPAMPTTVEDVPEAPSRALPAEQSAAQGSAKASASLSYDDDEEDSVITEDDLDDDIIAGLAAIWGEE